MVSTRTSKRLAAFLALLVMSGLTLVAQGTPPPIWKGVYTEDQAKRGSVAYEANCATCHGDDLAGGQGPALVDDRFERSWGARGLGRLFTKIQNSMPRNAVSSVTDTEKLAIVAYVLQANGFPAGTEELRSDPALLAIHIVGKNGPGPAPSGAIVEVVGCLAEEANAWTLTRATEPVVSTMDGPGAGGAAGADTRPLGTGTVTLLDVFVRPDALKGHRMLAKGLLIRMAGAVKVNIVSLVDVAPSCSP